MDTSWIVPTGKCSAIPWLQAVAQFYSRAKTLFPSGFFLDKNATKPIVPAKRKGFEQLFREGGFRTDPVGVSMKLAPITGGCRIIGPIRSIRLSRRS